MTMIFFMKLIKCVSNSYLRCITKRSWFFAVNSQKAHCSTWNKGILTLLGLEKKLDIKTVPPGIVGY